MPNTKISALSPAGTLDGTEILPLVKAGSTVKASVSSIAAAAPPNTYVVYVTGLVGDGATIADRLRIQTQLSLAPAGGTVRVPFVGQGIYLLETPLITPPGAKVHLVSEPGVTYRRQPGSGPNYNFIVNSAVATTGSAGMDGAVSAGATAVTSAAFVSGNVGQPFTIMGAGVGYTTKSGTVTGGRNWYFLIKCYKCSNKWVCCYWPS